MKAMDNVLSLDSLVFKWLKAYGVWKRVIEDSQEE